MWWKLYRHEYSKIIRHRGLTVYFFSIFFVYIFLLIKSLTFLSKLEIITQASLPIIDYLKFPVVFGTTAWLASFFTFFYAIFFLIYLKLDWSEVEMAKDLRSYFLPKLNFMFVFSFDWTLTAIATALIIGGRVGTVHGLDFFPNQLISLPVQVFFYFSFAFLIAALTRTAAQAVASFIGYFVLEAFVRNFLFSLNLTIGHYLPVKIATRLVEPPSVQFMTKFALNEYLSNNPLPFALNIMLALVYSIVFIILALKILKTKTLKSV